jgi:hypothetical protein
MRQEFLDELISQDLAVLTGLEPRRLEEWWTGN